jgi:hypothetical protein
MTAKETQNSNKLLWDVRNGKVNDKEYKNLLSLQSVQMPIGIPNYSVPNNNVMESRLESVENLLGQVVKSIDSKPVPTLKVTKKGIHSANSSVENRSTKIKNRLK